MKNQKMYFKINNFLNIYKIIFLIIYITKSAYLIVFNYLKIQKVKKQRTTTTHRQPPLARHHSLLTATASPSQSCQNMVAHRQESCQSAIVVGASTQNIRLVWFGFWSKKDKI